MHQGVREKIAEVAATARESTRSSPPQSNSQSQAPAASSCPISRRCTPGGCSPAPISRAIVHLVRDLAGCQISLTPSASTFANSETAGWLSKYFAVGDVEAEERRKLLRLRT